MALGQNKDVLPQPNGHGLLDPGVHEAPLDSLPDSWLVRGPRDWRGAWCKEHRQALLRNATDLLSLLRKGGIHSAKLTGQFVEAIPHPACIQLYIVCPFSRFVCIGEPFATLEQLARKVWAGGPRAALPILRDRYGIDLVYEVERSTILDDTLTTTRDGTRKGIVEVRL